jgi:hypothetical protein
MSNPDIRARWGVYLSDAATELESAHSELVNFVIAAAQDGMTQREIAAAADKSPSWVHNTLTNAGLKYVRKAVST